MYLLKVLVEMPALALDDGFDYLSEEPIENRVRVKVAFNNRKIMGYVTKCEKISQSKAELEAELGYKLRYISEIVDSQPLVNQELDQLAVKMAHLTFSSHIACLNAMLPPQLKPGTNKSVGKKYQTVIKIKEHQDVRLTPKQLEAYEFLQKVHQAPLKECPFSRAVAAKLIEHGVAEKIKAEVYRDVDFSRQIPSQPPVLTLAQQAVVSDILANRNKSFTALIHGVTGSGKTEVYLNLAAKTISDNRQVLMLVPEISLTPMMVAAFKGRFGDQVAIIHSRLSQGERYDEYRKIVRNEVNIVVGARSAVFAPLDNIGLIVMDEEHDSSYKQDAKNPRYNTRQIATIRSHTHNCPLVLGSATPSIESYARAKNGIYRLYELKERINQRKLPPIKLVDMKEELKNGNYSIFSRELADKIKVRIGAGEQVILMLNKRGYATYLQCRDCGTTLKCPHCDVTLTYHKAQNKLKCHYCDFETYYHDECPECHGHNLKQIGEGTQRVEEIITETFENAKVLRFDVDSTRNKNGHLRILEQFANQEANILLGTQMLSKGLDFDNVTLVGVLNADIALNVPDFRANERAYQLLEQVSGRAGRKDKPGEVVIQIFDVAHPTYQCVANHDYRAFFNIEMKYRKMANYPPFIHMASVLVTSKNENYSTRVAANIANYLGKSKSFEVLGPANSLIYKLNDRYRNRILVKFKNSKDVSRYLQSIVDNYANDQKATVIVDFNPYNQL